MVKIQIFGNNQITQIIVKSRKNLTKSKFDKKEQLTEEGASIMKKRGEIINIFN